MQLFNQRDENGMASPQRNEVEKLNRNKAQQNEALQNSLH